MCFLVQPCSPANTHQENLLAGSRSIWGGIHGVRDSYDRDKDGRVAICGTQTDTSSGNRYSFSMFNLKSEEPDTFQGTVLATLSVNASRIQDGAAGVPG